MKKIARLLSILTIFTLLFVQVGSVSAQQMSQEQHDLYLGGIRHFEIEETVLGDGTCSTAVVPGIRDSQKVADAIDAFIVAGGGQGGPLEGLGQQIVEGATSKGVNPFLVVAIARQESSFGTAGIATQGTNNAFGRTPVGSQPKVTIDGRDWYKWSTWELSVNGPDDEARLLKDAYIDEGLTTVDQIINTYAPESDGNDPAGYIQKITGWITEMVAASGNGLDCGPGEGGPGGDPEANKRLAEVLAAQVGWTGEEWGCLLDLWEHESGWNQFADNPGSTAYGIPQALLGTHEADIRANYPGYFSGTPEAPTGGNPEHQIRWGIKYIKGRADYGGPNGTPCAAWTLWQRRSPHWY